MSRIPAPWLKSILLTIYPKPAITRDEIIRSTGLNPASVSQALQHLLSSGTVLKVGELKSRGGRRREVLKLNPEAGYFIAVDLETARIRYALTNLVGDIRYRWEQELEFGKGVDVADLLHGMAILAPPRCRDFLPWNHSRKPARHRGQSRLAQISALRETQGSDQTPFVPRNRMPRLCVGGTVAGLRAGCRQLHLHRDRERRRRRNRGGRPVSRGARPHGR